MLSCDDEVGETVAFFFHAAGVVPRLSELSAAADVRDGVDYATVQQAEPVRTEIDRHGDSVAAVAIEKKRGRAVARRIMAVDDGKRHAGAVGSGGMQTLADVLRRIVAAENGLLLPEASFTRANVVVKDGARSYERFILEPDMGGAELRVFTDGSVVGGLGEFDAMRHRESVWTIRSQIHDAEIRKAALAFEKHEVALESLRGSKHDVWAIGNDFAPEFSARVGRGGGHQAEGASARIRANVK